MPSLYVKRLNGVTGFYLSIQACNTASSFDARSSIQMLSSQKRAKGMIKLLENMVHVKMFNVPRCSRYLRTKGIWSQPKMHHDNDKLDPEDSPIWQTNMRTGNWVRTIHSDIWCVFCIGRMTQHWNTFRSVINVTSLETLTGLFSERYVLLQPKRISEKQVACVIQRFR